MIGYSHAGVVVHILFYFNDIRNEDHNVLVPYFFVDDIVVERVDNCASQTLCRLIQNSLCFYYRS